MSDPLPEFLRELGFVLLQHRGQGLFALLSPSPRWLAELWEISESDNTKIPIAERSPFLENFLMEADAFWKSNNQGFFQSETWIERSAAGKEIPLKAVALHLHGDRFLALHSPELEFRERVQLLQTARNSLLDQERLQSEIQKKEILLHCIIHDLSQPLSVMSVTFDCMTEERISEKGKNLLELGKKASDQQLSMIRDILQVFSADLKASLEVDIKGESPDLLSCAESVLHTFEPVFAAKNVKLGLHKTTDEGEEWRVRGEELRLQRIFSNLLENAVRYAPQGSRVTIRLAQAGGFVRASVDDEGPGLPADLSSTQIFGLFSKGKDGGKAGLGLYFCRLTVERWGGSIGCESLPERGARFWFQLPRAATQARPTEMVRPPVPEPGPTKSRDPVIAAKKSHIRVLLAEDQKEIRTLTALQLERRGHEVVSVANGEQALRALEREAFDIALLDEDMPVMTGLQTMRTVRDRQNDFGSTILIALTGYNSEADQERLIAAGFDRVMGKPFRIDALDDLLRGTSDKPQRRRPQEVPTQQTPMAHLLDRVAGDEKLARKMVAILLRDTPKRMAGIQESLKRKNAEKLASLAHALKGAVAIFGAEGARLCAQQLQDLGRTGDFKGAASFYKQLKEEIAELEANLRGYALQNRSRGRGASPKTKRRTSKPPRKPR